MSADPHCPNGCRLVDGVECKHGWKWIRIITQADEDRELAKRLAPYIREELIKGARRKASFFGTGI